MKILIIEDELPTANYLETLILQYNSSFEIVAKLSSVEDSIDWFKTNIQPDLIFQDISLSDGNCFEIYKQVMVQSPLIFTTAYSEYALESFQLNSIDYIVKPYDFEDIKRVLNKFSLYSNLFITSSPSSMNEIQENNEKKIKKRFLVSIGEQLKTVNTEEIAFIRFDEGLTFLHLYDGKKYPIDKSISTLESQLATSHFFRINRKYIIKIDAIKKINTWFNSRLQIETDPPTPEELIVSRERVKAFKDWLDS
ncbi:LytR/AlgR family response regulator transcription factor [Flammeovirga kamogawensis]|uniref:LytTR family DNA-binding domain-containing protein n=1 Tax=Flammeovirga kamogawensis TaxID=373891 RepID=A0ABX8GZZ4_9BACT|nr:LytTR family DNA-binding domain-containing protein [Flammeovirga kamogawensis]MBB6459418.1 DNA-binding LytR/AlgR family response regulator [Flammeovirga kamogawensis]QWG08973.1 LytTR family DNA-binding domain-containing protein [Flammeovirga kamogawensis]TRX67263.1 response regulator transcription factor [Flammeovirga kamogawensis]